MDISHLFLRVSLSTVVTGSQNGSHFSHCQARDIGLSILGWHQWKMMVCSSRTEFMWRSTRNFNIPPTPPAKTGHLNVGSFKFPPPPAKIMFKCPTQSSNLSVRCRRRFLSSLMKLVDKHANTCLATLYMMMPFTKTQLNIETAKNHLKLNQLPSRTMSISKCKLL